jgi:Tfp pilus assembly protein PilN
MLFGVAAPARKSGPQLVDLNLVPAEYRPKPFPVVTVGLGLLVVGSLVLLYALFYAKTYSDLEINALNLRIIQAQQVVQSATGDPTTLGQREQLRAMRDDYRVLAQRQINWGDVFQTVGDVPPGIILNTVNQAGFGVSVTGSAANETTAAAYLEKLRQSGLFVNASIQVQPSSNPDQFATPTAPPPPPTQPPPTLPPQQPLQAPAAAPIQPTPPRPPAPTVPAPLAAPPPIPSATPAKTLTPTTTPTRAPTLTSTPTLTATPAFNYALITNQQIALSNQYAPTSDIKGQVVDLSKNPLSGVLVQIESNGSPPWSAQATTDSNGNFDFSVTHGNFNVYVVDPRTQQAASLYTGANGVAGVYGYNLVFQRTWTGTPPPLPPGFASPTQTFTDTPIVTPTPIVPGANVANLGCASAYMVQNGNMVSFTNGSNPAAAIDGNPSTEWNAGVAPSNGTQIIWRWQLPEPGQAGSVQSGCTAAGLADDADQIVAFELMPDQNPAGTTDHELWLYSDPGCTVNLQTSGTAYYTWNQETTAGQTLPLNISTALPVRCIVLRTVSDPSFVAWEEIQIFQALPPPSGFLTLTPTLSPTITPTNLPACSPTCTPTATPLESATPTLTATITPSLTATSTPTPTSTIAPPPYPTGETNIALSETAIYTTYSNGSGFNSSPVTCPGITSPNNPCNVLYGDLGTSWVPLAESTDPQGVLLQFPGNGSTYPSYYVQIVVKAPPPPEAETVGYNVFVNGSLVVCTATYPLVNGAVITCLYTPTTPATLSTVEVTLNRSLSSSLDDGTYGIVKLQVWVPAAPPPFTTSTPTPTPTTTPVGPTPTITNTSTQVGAAPSGVIGVARLVGSGQGARSVHIMGPAITTPSPESIGGQPGIVSQGAPGQPGAPKGGPVDFTIVLEAASGKGY